MEGQDKGVKTYFRIHFSHKAAKPQRQVSGFVHRLHRFQRLALTRRRRGAGSQTESDRPAEEVCVSYSLQPTASRLGCNLRPSAMTPACAGQVCLRKSLLRASVPSCEDRRSSAFIGGSTAVAGLAGGFAGRPEKKIPIANGNPRTDRRAGR